MGKALPQEIGVCLRLGLTLIPLKPRSKVPLEKWRNRWNPTHEEFRACASLSLELSSIGFFILFNSAFNPTVQLNGFERAGVQFQVQLNDVALHLLYMQLA
jgi:hypothetical protein